MMMTRNEVKNEQKFTSGSVRFRPRSVVFVAGCLVFACFLFFNRPAEMKIQENPAGSAELPVIENGTQDFSKFQHSNQQHARLPCLLCHKRENNSPVPRLPGHLPCTGCHQQQFDAGNQHPICTICHTSTGVKQFPRLRSFNALFDHAKHLRQTGCTTCHKPSRRGVGFSIPADLQAHSSCFQCHTAQAQSGERSLGSCNLCHQPGRPPGRVSDWAKAYTVNFSHAAHGPNRNLNCTVCHTFRTGMGRGRQVSAPLPSMHFAPARSSSCAGCHNNQRAFGGNDFSDCKRCHTGKSFRF